MGGSIYGSHSSSGGSSYGQTGGSFGVSGAPKKHGGGGLFGFLGSAGHWLGQKAGLAGHDIAQIPSGMLTFGEDFNPFTPAYYSLTGQNAKMRRENAKSIGDLVGMAKSTETSVRHPLRDPFQTALTISPFGHGLGASVERAAAVGDAARAGEGLRGLGKALAKAPEPKPRLLRVGDDKTPVSLIASRNPTLRLAQRGYDRMVQRALDREATGAPVGRVTGRIAKHGMKRIAGALGEEERLAQRMRAVPAQMLDRSAAKLGRIPAARRLHQAALELTSTQTPAEEAAAYHYGQAAKGINPDRNTGVAKLYERVAHHNLVHVDETRPSGAKVYINPEHERLVAADKQLARVQERGDTILAEKGVMTPEQLAARNDAPARVRAGASYEKPTPGKLGKPSVALLQARAKVAGLEAKHAAATERALSDRGSLAYEDLPGSRVLRSDYAAPAEHSPPVARLSAALSVAKDDLQRLEGQAANRVKPTGLIGGENARPGRGFISERVSQKKLARSEAATGRSPVIGETKSPIDKKPYTGRALEHGLRPKNVTAAASRHFQQISRFVNTDAIRRRAIETSAPARRSGRDILIRVPDETAEQLNHHMRQVLGQETPTVDTAEELAHHAEDTATQEGLAAAHRMFVSHILDRAEASKSETVGVVAPKGYRWVDENLIRGLQQEATPRSAIGAGVGRVVDDVNSAITALTVYFKVGHIGTRVLTNAATNLIQGSLDPFSIAKSYRLWRTLNDEDRARFLAASGQHGFAALPAEARDVIGRGAQKGAQFWARHADAPFRFNSLAYELRKVGYKTADQTRVALHALEHHGDGVAAHEWAKVSTAARRADREAIAYDRLNPFEKRYLTRAVWFYPWIKGASLFTVRTALEHPYKSAILGTAGVQGREAQQKALGDVPSYEQGLVALNGGAHPLTTDLSTFSPFATFGQLLEAPAHPGAAAGYFNPAVGAAGDLAYGVNQYGSPSKSPLKDALLSLGSPTPEQQLAEAYAMRGQDQSNRMFEKSPFSTLLRYLVGPAMPRRVNPSALAKAAARERSGQR